MVKHRLGTIFPNASFNLMHAPWYSVVLEGYSPSHQLEQDSHPVSFR